LVTVSPGESRARVRGWVPSAKQVSLSVFVGLGDTAFYATIPESALPTSRSSRVPAPYTVHHPNRFHGDFKRHMTSMTAPEVRAEDTPSANVPDRADYSVSWSVNSFIR